MSKARLLPTPLILLPRTADRLTLRALRTHCLVTQPLDSPLRALVHPHSGVGPGPRLQRLMAQHAGDRDFWTTTNPPSW